MAEQFSDLESFYSTTLSTSIDDSATTINVATAPNVNTAFLVIEPNTPNEEIVKMTSRSDTALTVVRGLATSGGAETDAGNGVSHPAGAKIEIANAHYYIKQILGKNTWSYRGDYADTTAIDAITNAETGDMAIDRSTGTVYWYNGSSWIAITQSDSLPDASTSVKGVTKLSVAPVSASDPIAVGDNDPRLDGVSGSIIMYGGASAPSGYLLCDGSAVSRTTYSDLFTAIGTTYGAGDGSTTFNVPDLRSVFPVGLGQRTETFDFVDGDVNTSTEEITVDSNDWLQTGTAVVLSTSGTLPTGLSATTYYVIRVNATTIKLATTVANANAGTAVDITGASGGGTHTLTLTLTNRSLADEGGEEDHALTDSEMPSHHHDWSSNGNQGAGDRISNTGASNSGARYTTGAELPSIAGSDSKHNNMPPYVTVNFIIKT